MVGYPQLFIKLAYIYGPGYLCTLDGVHSICTHSRMFDVNDMDKASTSGCEQACMYTCMPVCASHACDIPS